jgi:prepilin peptidase CpaA
MNASHTTSAVSPLSTFQLFTSPRARWASALLLPAIVGPAWCLAWRGSESQVGTLAGLSLLALITTSAITDFRGHKIYNWATYAAILWALAINIVASHADSASAYYSPMFGAVGAGACLGGAALCFLITFVGYDLSGGGAGDVKLATAIGAFLGIEHGVFAVAYSYAVAGVCIMAFTAWTNGPFALLKAASRSIGTLLGPLWPFPVTPQDKSLLTRPIPLGPYFAIGTLLVVLELVPTWQSNF